MKAIRVHTYGGPDQLTYDDLPTPDPAPGQVRLRTAAIGVNFIDVYHREGRYPLPLPFIPGVECAGTVEAVAPDVTEVQVGDRVAFVHGGAGNYAEQVLAPAARLVPIPVNLSEVHAVAALVQGTTAYFLTHDTFAVKPGHTVLIHAAAGGVGLLLTQVCKKLGARVIGTVSTPAKAQAARAAGADEVILYTESDFAAETKRITEGRGVEVVYDSVGATTFEAGLGVLRPRGMMVLYGASSGPAPLLDPNSLGGKGSLFVTRPSLFHHIASREDLLAKVGQVFAWAAAGDLQIQVNHTFPLAAAAQAHRALEARQTTGKVVLTVDSW